MKAVLGELTLYLAFRRATLVRAYKKPPKALHGCQIGAILKLWEQLSAGTAAARQLPAGAILLFRKEFAMELKVICKRLMTEDLDGMITEGESGADVVCVTVPRYYDRHDLSRFSFRMTAVPEDGSNPAEQVLKRDSVNAFEVRLIWTVTSVFSACRGLVTLVLTGTDGKTRVKFTSAPVSISDDTSIELVPVPELSEQLLDQVQLEVQKAVDAASRAEELAKGYEIKPAAESEVGGILSGGDVSVSDIGAVTVNSVGGKTLGTSVPEDAKFTDTLYELPKATEQRLGGIKSGGDIYVSAGGTVKVNSICGNKVGTSVPADAKFTDTVYELPKATAKRLGGIRVDGRTITVDGKGIISVIGAKTESGEIILPKATEDVLGAVRADGDTINVDADGILSARQYVLPTASEEALGGVKSGGDISVSESGDVTVNSVGGKTIGTSVPEDAVFTDTVYTLPTASESAHGGVKSGGDISVSESGDVTVNSVGGNTVKTSVPEDAVFTDTVYTLPPASAETLGGVKVDGSTISADGDGVISAAQYVLPEATAEALGGVKSGGDISVSESGDVTVNSVGGNTVETSVPADALFTDTVYEWTQLVNIPSKNKDVTSQATLSQPIGNFDFIAIQMNCKFTNYIATTGLKFFKVSDFNKGPLQSSKVVLASSVTDQSDISFFYNTNNTFYAYAPSTAAFVWGIKAVNKTK